MKEFRGQATGTVSAEPEQCFELLLAVERYPDAYPEVIRQVEVIERHAGGLPLVARATVFVALGPVQRDFELLVKLAWEADRMVRLTRVPYDRSDLERMSLTWQIRPGPPTRLTVKLRARLDVPWVIPMQGAGGTVARGLLAAASRTLERG